MNNPSDTYHLTRIVNKMLRAISLICFFVGVLGMLTFGIRYARYEYVFGKIPIDPTVGFVVSLLLVITALTIPMVKDLNPKDN